MTAETMAIIIAETNTRRADENHPLACKTPTAIPIPMLVIAYTVEIGDWNESGTMGLIPVTIREQ